MRLSTPIQALTGHAGGTDPSGTAAPTSPGYVLLMSAAPRSGRVVDAATGTARLAAMPPAALVGTAVASAVYLTDPVEPNTVLTHLRTAAAAPGPLLVYVLGQVCLDRRQRQPHVALAGTTGHTVRYTALPWAWIANELRLRVPGSFTVLADLVAADAATWEQLSAEPEEFAAGLPLFGTIAPPPPKRSVAPPRYTNALAEVLRHGTERMTPDRLHRYAVSHADLGDGPELLFHTPPALPAPMPEDAPRPDPATRLALPPPATPLPPPPAAAPPVAAPPPAPHPVQPVPPAAPAAPAGPDPHTAIREAARAGRFNEANEIVNICEQATSRATGPHSAATLHWKEVRADLAMLADDPSGACALWMDLAGLYLSVGRGPADAPVVDAVDRAHHCWGQIGDPGTALRLAGDLVPLRRAVPGHRTGSLQKLEHRVELLAAAPPGPRRP